MSAEKDRLHADADRSANWKRWGPYLSERQWGTVREDYSPYGDCWNYFSHDQARSRAYRWGEDGLLGITDRECRLCFGFAFWNGQDQILKERLFGLTGPEGNHGEDVKELYYYLDSTPTHSYLRALYKYPQAAFPYEELVRVNRERNKLDPEYELLDTGVFNEDRYFDILAEYAKRSPDDIVIKLTVANRAAVEAKFVCLPTLWFRNTWSWGKAFETDATRRPVIRRIDDHSLLAEHPSFGPYRFEVAKRQGEEARFLFTENETNFERLYQSHPPGATYTKDAFHRYVIQQEAAAVNSQGQGSKAANLIEIDLAPQTSAEFFFRLSALESGSFDLHNPRTTAACFDKMRKQADDFYGEVIPADLTKDEKVVARQAYAGLLWSKQFYHFVVADWLDGDPQQPKPPPERLNGRNHDWRHLFSRDILSMPDKWEYPWFAAWDLAFHTVPMARVDPQFAKEQLLLLLREWYLHPNGQMPAYEFAFSDVNPPVNAWAAWRVYKMTGPRGRRDLLFLERVFQKLLLNFTWWVNRKDAGGKNLFSGGFLGLDNIAVFDRSGPTPKGGELEQADGTSWMGFFCATMLLMALELAQERPAYEDIASKFFEHFIAIIDAINSMGGQGLWDEEDGFYYDQLRWPGSHQSLKVRSIVGVIPVFAVGVLRADEVTKLTGFTKRMEWFLKNKPQLAAHVVRKTGDDTYYRDAILLGIPPKAWLERILRYVLDEREFLSPYGVRAVSAVHREKPFQIQVDGQILSVDYVPGEGNSGAFGGNSNWRGPIWFPVNYLLIEALQRYHLFYGDKLKVECPVGSGKMLNLREVAIELSNRLTRIFVPDQEGRRPCHGTEPRYQHDPHWADLVLFYEYFHGDTGRGCGASHQTGWTALITKCLEGCERTEG